MNLGIPGYHVGDCRDLLRRVPDGSINCCVTSPPYWGLRDYGTDRQLGLECTPEEYVANMTGVFREVRRALRDDGTLWLNLGDSYAASAKGSGGTAKSGLMRDGRPEAQRSATAAESIAHQMLGGRRAFDLSGSGLKPKDLVGIPWRVAFALQADGWYLRSDIIWSKPNPMPESVTDRPTKAHEYLFLLSKSERYHYDAEAIQEAEAETSKRLKKYDTHWTLRPGNGEGNCDGKPWRMGGGKDGKRNRRTVWEVATEPTPDAHFATYPRKLIEPCILAGCPLGGVVLDPFGGSGTTGRVAEDLGRKWLLFDLNPKYAQIAKRKTAQVGLLGRLEAK